MDEAFVIMQIGNEELDKLWKDAYQPAIKECGLNPKRVDKHNEGRLLQSEIADFINRAKVVIADLTNERPNCYLEVGYTMGVGKFKNLILCAREDHHHESKNYVKGGPKIHFDLSGYGFLWWEKADLDKFRKELSDTIKYRLKILKEKKNSSNNSPKSLSYTIADMWLEDKRREAIAELKKLGFPGFYDITFQLLKSLPDKKPQDLLKIAEKSEVHISGWPIGVVLHNERKPKPESDGIKAIIPSEDLFDYWFLRRDGRFYFLRSYEEDRKIKENIPGKNIHLDTRIRRIAEAIIYCSRLYKEFNIEDKEKIDVEIFHSGLRSRIIRAADPNRLIMDHWECSVNEVNSHFTEELGNLLPNIKDLVFKISNELFTMFDYFEVDRKVSDDIVDKFISRKS